MTGRVRELVASPRFQRLVLAVILVNAVTLGLESVPAAMDRFGDLLIVIDTIALSLFVVELGLRIYAHGWRFFTDPWSVFDFIVVAIAVAPALGAFTAMRAFRVLRVLRLISAPRATRRVVGGLLAAIPGMSVVIALLGLMVYVGAVIATYLFDDIAPDYFGDLGSSLFTMFQVLTGEAWPTVAAAVLSKAPLAWIFFVAYILVSSFAVLNLFIAVFVRGMQTGVTDDLTAAEHHHATTQAAHDRLLLTEIRALRAELAALRTATRATHQQPDAQ